MRTIYKYPLEDTDHQTVKLPLGAEPLSVMTQNNEVCLWALVDPEAPPSERHFRIYGTGHPLDEGAHSGNYIGSCMTHHGMLVWHIFEE